MRPVGLLALLAEPDEKTCCARTSKGPRGTQEHLPLVPFPSFFDHAEQSNCRLFYRHCMQVMAPSGILALFPETDDGTCWLKPLKALEAVKTIFTNAAEPLQLRQFIVSRIEPLIDPKTK
jgi:hypothetical protein